LGFGHGAQPPIPNPQSPIPIFIRRFYELKKNYLMYLDLYLDY
jgi:hypothetical protein